MAWLGDGYCDEMGGCWIEGPQYDCPELGYDCGDCNDEWDGGNSSGLCTESPCAPLYDTNDDGIVNILDVIMVVNLILFQIRLLLIILLPILLTKQVVI